MYWGLGPEIEYPCIYLYYSEYQVSWGRNYKAMHWKKWIEEKYLHLNWFYFHKNGYNTCNKDSRSSLLRMPLIYFVNDTLVLWFQVSLYYFSVGGEKRKLQPTYLYVWRKGGYIFWSEYSKIMTLKWSNLINSRNRGVTLMFVLEASLI